MKVRKTLARMTRRAFRKKLITFGVSTFMCLALTATGFAAWMLSNDANKGASGEIEVAAVSEAGIEVGDLAFLEKDASGALLKNFKFEPLEDDTDGRVRWDKKNSEDMDIKIGWTLTNYQNVKSTYLELEVPATIKTLIDNEYIALPSEFSWNADSGKYVYSIPELKETPEPLNDGRLTYKYNKDGESVNIEFELTLTFLWGDKFAGQNPSYYFDEHETGKLASYDTIKNTLNELKAAAHGLTPERILEQIATADKANGTDLATQYKDETNTGVLLGLLSEKNQQSLFDKAPVYKLTVYALAA